MKKHSSDSNALKPLTVFQTTPHRANPSTLRTGSVPTGATGLALPCLKLVLAAWIALGWASESRGFAIFGANGGFDDVVNAPQNRATWGGTIHYSFDDKFNAMFPDPRTKDQVRRALATWAAASSTPKGSVYSYQRANPAYYGSFSDMRSTTLHEVGHTLGFAHPADAAQQNPSLNFIPAADAQVGCANPGPGPASGREVMNPEINGYNHVLSWDELDGFCNLYSGQTLNFVEVPSGGELVFTTGPLGACQPNGSGGFQCLLAIGNESDQYSGQPPGTIYQGAVTYNTDNTKAPLGTSTHGVNWDITCGSDTHTITIQTHGTDNPAPMDWWNNNNTPYVFGSPSTPPAAAGVDADHKDDLNWTWTNPSADIPANVQYHVGLELDVDDWTVVTSTAYDAQNNPAPVALTVAHDFDDAVFEAAALEPTPRWLASTQPAGTDGSGVPGSNPQGATYSGNTTNGCISGIAIVASQIPQTVISGFEYADVTGLGLKLSDLNNTGLNRLRANGMVITVTNFGTHILGSSGRFIVALDGQASCLPVDVATNGNYLMLNQPQLLSRELFLHWQSANAQTTVQNFSLVGEPFIGNLPQLTISSPVPGTNSVVLSWPSAYRGFVLQQTYQFGTTNWLDVPTQPMLINGQNHLVLWPPPNHNSVFYRLRKAF